MKIEFQRTYRKIHGGIYAPGETADTELAEIGLIHAQQAIANEAAVEVKAIAPGSYKTTEVKAGLFKGRK